jgi:tetratricopeptide (TPR) repeat protein
MGSSPHLLPYSVGPHSIILTIIYGNRDRGKDAMNTIEGSQNRLQASEVARELFVKGISWWSQKKVEKALRCFQRAHELKPEDPHIASYLGLVLVDSGIYNRGFELCRAALRKNPSDADLLFNLGQAYLLASRRKEARLTFLRGAKLSGDNHRFIDALIKMGIRRKPTLQFLSRDHLLNHWLGKLTYRPETVSIERVQGMLG